MEDPPYDVRSRGIKKNPLPMNFELIKLPLFLYKLIGFFSKVQLKYPSCNCIFVNLPIILDLKNPT